MSTIAQAPASGKATARRRPRALARARPSRAASCGSSLVGVMLAGIVALNVVVLQLNMEFDGLSRERAQLRADNALLRSRLSSASSHVRIEDAAKAKLGLQEADAADDDLRSARGEVRERRANHRIRLLLLVVRPPVRHCHRTCGVRAGGPARPVREDGDHAASRDDRGAGGTRDDLRSNRGAARDRRAGDDDLREPAQHRRCAAGRRRDRQDARTEGGRPLSGAEGSIQGVRVRRPARPTPSRRMPWPSGGSPVSASTRRSSARIHKGTSPPTSSASPEPTITGSTGWSARSTRRLRGGPDSRRSSRIPSVAPSTS